jgi:hypothetical protein
MGGERILLAWAHSHRGTSNKLFIKQNKAFATTKLPPKSIEAFGSQRLQNRIILEFS